MHTCCGNKFKIQPTSGLEQKRNLMATVVSFLLTLSANDIDGTDKF